MKYLKLYEKFSKLPPKTTRPSSDENYAEMLSLEELAKISDEALDNEYHYGRSQIGNNFGWLANIESAKAAKEIIESGVKDIEKISNAIHDGWNKTAMLDYNGKLKLDTPTPPEKKEKRKKLADLNYYQLPEEEKEKDRVVAKALLKAFYIRKQYIEAMKKDWELRHDEDGNYVG